MDGNRLYDNAGNPTLLRGIARPSFEWDASVWDLLRLGEIDKGTRGDEGGRGRGERGEGRETSLMCRKLTSY